MQRFVQAASGREILFFLSVCIFFSLFSCGKFDKRDYLKEALVFAGENRSELEKVLKHYSENPADSLKYRAACFLIENMPYYHYYEGSELDSAFTYFSELHDKKHQSPEEILNKHTLKYGSLNTGRLSGKIDIRTIDSAFLCNNIEWSFKVWEEQPWGKHISFDDFCEYILPYRIGDERPVSWRQYYYEKYFPILKEACKGKEVNDPIKAAMLLYDLIDKNDARFTTTGPANTPHVGPYISELKTGTCRELTDFLIYLYRSLGIPCTIDFIRLWGDNNVGHFWLAAFDKKNNVYMQEFPENLNASIRGDNKPKVCRQTFSLNRELMREMNKLEASVYPDYVYPKFKDVTLDYSACFTETLNIPEAVLFEKKSGSKIAYLCYPSGTNWVPLGWTEFKRDKLQFKQVQKGSVAVIATYENGVLELQSHPFIVHCPSGEIECLRPNDDNVEDITLFCKFRLWDDQYFIDRMVGGVFEGSNFSDFRERDTLYYIYDNPYRLLTNVESKQDKLYRYVRYYGPEKSNCNIAEVSFYKELDDSVPLSGKVIGTPGSWGDAATHEYTNVFDGLTTTSFDYKYESGGWAGLDLGEPKRISRIVYTPRNRDNYIRPGDTYELFFFGNGWESLGITTAGSDSLLYKSVPENVFLFLKNHTRGSQERIFTYGDEGQIWR